MYIIKRLLCFIIPLVVIYFFSALISWSWDISTWDIQYRVAWVIISLIIGFFIWLFSYVLVWNDLF